MKARCAGTVALAGLLVLLAAGRVWATAEVGGLTGTTTVAVTGRAVFPVLTGLALVLLASAVVLAFAGYRARLFSFAMTVVAGLGAVACGVAARDAVGPAVAAAVRERTGTVSAGPGPAATSTAWPWVAAVAGLVAVVAAVLGHRTHRGWERARRGDGTAEAAGTVPTVPDGPVAAGGDPAVPGRGGARTTGPAEAAGTVDPWDAWRALSHGDDPT